MEAMKAKMAADGGSRATAREIYTRMYEQSADEKVRDMARKRLLQLDSLDQRDGLRKLFAAYQARTGKCPNSWKEIEPVFRALRIRCGRVRRATRSERERLTFCERARVKLIWIQSRRFL